MSLRIMLVGYGRMGKEIESLSKAHDCEIVQRLDIDNNADGTGIDSTNLPLIDIAIDFSTPAATVENLPRLAKAGISTVIGTTGWNQHEEEMKRVVKASDIGVVVAANFSLGVNIFQSIVEKASACFAKQEDFSAWIHETHHEAKKDSPSGTALAIEKRMKDSGYKTPIAISSTRVGSVPGTHSVGFDGQFETITLTHTARHRSTFARGALEAARWLCGKQGWFTMQDVLDID